MKTFTRYSGLAALALSATLLTQACGGGEKKVGDSAAAPEAPVAAPAPAVGTGRTIIVEAYTDEKGNYFKPNEIEARKGDVIQFVLKMGVHNVNFLPDSNAGKKGLPKASDMLQLPGQTYDVPVTFEQGRYYFQCDPHALLGMKGHITVKD